MSDISNIIDRVKKLQALSTSANANEAAAAAAAANRLIDQYRLSLADLEIKESAKEPVEEADGYIYQSGKITFWRSNLAALLAKHYGCAIWNDADWSSGRMVSRYRLVGRRSDIGICHYMYSWLTLEIERLSNSEAKGRGRVFVSSYCVGFVSGISEQLKLSRVQVQEQATSSSIVKINERLVESEAELNRLHKLKKTGASFHSRIDHNAFSAGKNRGESIHLGAKLSTGGTKLLNG